MPCKNLCIIVHDIRSCYNVGSIFRTSEALGVDKLILTGYTPYPKSKDDTRPPHISDKIERQINKTALGTQGNIGWEHSADVFNTIDILKSEGYEIAALEQSENSIRLNEFKPPAKLALILGNEVNGISQDVLRACDFVVEIPLRGKKESLNVASAAAIAIHLIALKGQKSYN